ncbi:hypothetical protein AJ80_02456 [Polytolypa hystricis UAMH7299]|uniref:Uncharacterized protein n=1 Tax=Polytolypa hystricis (strain UAMH7299) TaxID=1447883 RepID=A0A2B7YRL4_POLH7|nr:hypothetical protein AJ80_02456 [Polytolypa hystricis UAMH7299]
MAFTGPAGHGKSLLAEQIGTVIPLHALVKRRSTASLSDTKGVCKPLVVYVDDADHAVQSQNLIALLDAKAEADVYTDRLVTYRTIERSNIICVLATTQCIEDIPGYVHESLKREDLSGAAVDRGAVELKVQLAMVYGTSLARRIHCIVPFTSFSETERELMAHKFLRSTADAFAQSRANRKDNMTSPRIELVIENEEHVSRHIA